MGAKQGIWFLTRAAGWVLLVALALAASSPCLAQTAWQSLAPGMEFTTLSADSSVRAGSGKVAILRIDPALCRFKVLAAEQGEDGHDAGVWLEESRAWAVVNAGQYIPDGSYLGLLVVDGKPRGRLVSQLAGMFVAEPNDPALPQARILDMRYTAFDPSASPYRQAAQSLMLLDRFGHIRVRRSPRLAHRTALAEDQEGRILIISTEGAHTLWELANFLAGAGLGLREVMCMDGGQEAQLAIRVGDFRYEQYGDPSGNPGIPIPWPPPSLPAALAVFPK